MHVTIIENPELRPMTEEMSASLCTKRTGDTYCENKAVKGDKCSRHAK